MFKYANKNVYDGDFRDGNLNGSGTLTQGNGNKYVGQFKDGKEHGKGTQTWTNGKKLVGSWNAGSLEGEFLLTDFKKGKLQKERKALYKANDFVKWVK